MRILLTNDDGIHAEGLAVLERIARTLSDDIWVVAPESDQSGYSHSLSISDPLRMRSIDDRHFAVSGTPTDCVIMAVRHIMPEAPDLILSGVNSGSNVADDVTYSGTVAGAIEGTLLGIRSISISQAYNVVDEQRVVPWGTVGQLAPALLKRLVEFDQPDGVFLNVNFPNCPIEEIKGERVTAQGRSAHSVRVEKRADGRKLPYYWLGFSRGDIVAAEGSDMEAVRNGYVSITPLHFDFTAYEVQDRLRNALK